MSNQRVRSSIPKASDICSGVTYQAVNLSDLVIECIDAKPVQTTAASQASQPSQAADASTPRTMDKYTIADKQQRFEKTVVSSRFLTSLGRKTGVNKDYFKTFSPGEVLARVVAKGGDRPLIVASDDRQILGVTRPDDTLVRADQAMKVINGFSPAGVSYANGEIKASFDLRRGGGDTDILGENYAKKFVLSVPIDGLGMPAVSPLLIRLICTNGMVGEGPMFSSDIKIGRSDAGFTLERAISTYSGDQPFARIAERLELSKKAFASVAEVRQFVEILVKHNVDKSVAQTVWNFASSRAMSQATTLGNDNPRYLRKLATDLCRYDLINMATEVRSHVVTEVVASRVLDAFVSTLLTRDPDLEGSIDSAKETAPVPIFFAKAA